MAFIGFGYLDNEIKWKKIYWIDGDETKYSISNDGRVRNDNTGKILITNFSKGYERINLTHNGIKKQYFIHRLVATAFILNSDNKPEVNHINGIKCCNYDYNLEWVNREENQIHAIKNGLITYDNLKTRNKLTDQKVIDICKLLEQNELSLTQIGKKVGCSRHVVDSILNKKTYVDVSDKFDLSKYIIKTNFSKCGDNSERTKYPDKQIKLVCELIDSGRYTLSEISKKINVPYQTVRNVYYGICRNDISKNYNFRKTDKNPLYEDRKILVIKVCDLLDNGYNSREVAEKLNVNRSFVRNILFGNVWKDITKNREFMLNKKK